MKSLARYAFLALLACCLASNSHAATTGDAGFTQMQVNEPVGATFYVTFVTDPNTTTTNPDANTISGKLIDATTNEPAAGITAGIYDINGALVTNAISDEMGYYKSALLTAGTYYVKTVATDNYVSTLFNGTYTDSGTVVFTDINYLDTSGNSAAALCLPDCDITSGTQIDLIDGNSIGLQDILLEEGGLISGTITDADSGVPLPDITVIVYDSTGRTVTFAHSDADGHYISSNIQFSSILPSGTYYLSTFHSPGYFDESYDDAPFIYDCYPCDVSASTPVSVIHNSITTGIDFALKKGGRISGTITDADSGDPLKDISVNIYSENGSIAAYGWSDADGNYITSEPLEAGDYYVQTSDSYSGYINQSYAGDACTPKCDSTSGTLVSVEESTTTTGINFALKKGGQIAGTITDAISAQPLPDISLSVFDASGTFFANGWTDAAGHYLTSTGLPSGHYYLRTRNHDGYINECYNDLPCNAYFGTAAGGTTIDVIEGKVTSSIDLALNPGGRISGMVSDSLSGDLINNVSIYIYDSSGMLVDIANQSSGQYLSNAGLAPGTYYIHTENNLGYINQRYSDTPLAGPGAITDADAIVTLGTETVGGIDFTLTTGSRIAGRISNAETGLPFSGIYPRIEIYDTEGDPVSRAYPDADGNYLSGAAVPAGEYYVRAYDMEGKLQSQLYDGATFTGQCQEWQRCDVTAGTPITVNQDSDTMNIDFSLSLKAGSTATNNGAGALSIPLSAMLAPALLISLLRRRRISRIDRR